MNGGQTGMGFCGKTCQQMIGILSTTFPQFGFFWPPESTVMVDNCVGIAWWFHQTNTARFSPSKFEALISGRIEHEMLPFSNITCGNKARPRMEENHGKIIVPTLAS